MSRLVHSTGGYLRSLQISGGNFFAFVEGALDRTAYDRLLERKFRGAKFKYEIRSSKELPGNTGGKNSLIQYFKTLRSNKALSGERLGKKFVCVFFADKDIDDLSRRRVRSPHVLYTTTYDIEGHLLHHGDLVRAVADATGVSRAQAAGVIGNQSDLIKNYVIKWSDWTTLCIISQIHQINTGCTFERASAVNSGLIGDVDHSRLATQKTALRQRMNLSEADFARIYNRFNSKIIRSVSDNSALSLFKGKWFKAILHEHVRAALVVPDASLQGIGERVMLALVAQVGQKEQCEYCFPYDSPLDKLANLIQQDGNPS